jgi:pyridinium-3,5-bisthiocarboxylic acid mononucleotide nickel chelatase
VDENYVLSIDVGVSGVAGNMLLISALQILNFKKIEEHLEIIEKNIRNVTNHGFTWKIITKSYAGISGLNIEFDFGDVRFKVEDTLKQIQSLKHLLNHPHSKLFLESCFDLLIEAEKHVHNTENPHFHELADLDTLIDIYGFAYFLDNFKSLAILISPLAVGTGSISIKHGIVHLPVPATTFILEKSKLKTIQTNLNTELCTPTGTAILATLQEIFINPKNNVSWQSSTLGYGKKEFSDRMNAVRLRLGEYTSTVSKIMMLETHLDDISGEHLGYMLNKLLDEGAYDASYYPIFTKKNRPGWVLRVICSEERVDSLSELIMQFSGTLGIRVQNIDRHIGKREQKSFDVTILGQKETVFLKEGKYRSKIEFDDLIKLSNKYNKSPLYIEKLIYSQIKEE